MLAKHPNDLAPRYTFLQAEAARIALENFDSMNVPGVFRSFVQGVKSAFTDIHTFVKVEDIPELAKNQNVFLKLVNSTPYTGMKDIRAFAPEGLRSHYLDYLKDLHKATAHASKIESEIIDPYLSFLAKFIADKKFASSAYSEDVYFKAQEKNRKDLYTSLGHHFGRESYGGETTVGAVVARNSDWVHLFKDMNVVIDEIEVAKRQNIENKINQCSDYIELILKQFTTDTDRKVSQEAASRLSNHAYNVGRELEFYSNVYYRVLALRSCLQQTMDSVTNVFGE